MKKIHNGYAACFLWRKDDLGLQILLQKKDRGWKGDDFWTPFGGVVKNTESPTDCVVREVMEEINISIPSEKFLPFKTIKTKTPKGDSVPLTLFTSEFTNDFSEISLSEGCGVAFWYSDEIDSLTMQTNEKSALKEALLLL